MAWNHFGQFKTSHQQNDTYYVHVWAAEGRVAPRRSGPLQTTVGPHRLSGAGPTHRAIQPSKQTTEHIPRDTANAMQYSVDGERGRKYHTPSPRLCAHHRARSWNKPGGTPQYSAGRSAAPTLTHTFCPSTACVSAIPTQQFQTA